MQDGGTKGADRQKAMDAFNKPGSDYFVFLLTTRAGVSFISLYRKIKSVSSLIRALASTFL